MRSGSPAFCETAAAATWYLFPLPLLHRTNQIVGTSAGEVKHFFVRRTKCPQQDGASGQFFEKSVGYTSTVFSQEAAP